MTVRKKLLQGTMAFALAVGMAAPASASRFVHVGMDYLAAESETIVIGEVLEAHSYWTASGTFILTDAKVAVSEVLKGDPNLQEITVTLPGGSVGELSTVVVGGAELQPGTSYVLFLGRGNLPGAKGVQMVRDHSQGVFELVAGKDGLRAVSQARAHGLVPDASGAAEAPGGAEGLSLEAMKKTVRELAARGGRQEVK
jgi:hypothetical protein